MKAVILRRYGAEVEMADLPRPRPADGEVIIHAHAASLNPVDRKIQRGMMKPMLSFKLPQIMGHDVAGTIVEKGRDVTNFNVGDEVYAMVSKQRMGAFAELVRVNAHDACLKPSNLSFAEAASLPLVATTTAHALHTISRVQAGQKVFIKAGSGGLGTFAIQYAKALGLEVATTTSAKNIAFVSQLGADRVIDYQQQDFSKVLSDYDVVLDSVDGDDPARACAILKPGGHLIAVAGPPDARFAKEFGLNKALQLACAWMSRKETKAARARGIHYSFFFVEPSAAHLQRVKGLVESGMVRPVIDRIFALNEAREALAYLALGRSRGKVVLNIT
jgi:NADPH:quinone reductase-like Zn-dependent oxidoreductase